MAKTENLSEDYRITGTQDIIPTQWYNIQADMPNPLGPPIHPGTLEPIGPEALAPIFPEALIAQEMDPTRWISIPAPVLDMYRLYRPTPLCRAYRLEAALGTPAKIFYKYEGASPTGSHKSNTAIAQAYYNKEAGVERLTTETGAGQWGSALSHACSVFGLECTVYMVKVSYQQKPYRRSLMNIWGASVIPSPSDQTEAGRRILAETPDSPGSLGIAISEAVEDAVKRDDTKYALGSVLNHVLLHQTVIGLEAKQQFEAFGTYPDVVIGCCGGGSNFAGMAFPFLHDKIAGKDLRLIAIEPAACPTLTRGEFRYDFGDTGKMTPLLPMYTLGHPFVPAGIHAGGLRYHGAAPLLSQLVKDNLIEAAAYPQTPVFESAVTFAKAEGIVPAPESAHAVYGAIAEALRCKETGEEKVIAFCLSGHGMLDLAAYDAYLAGNLVDYEHPQEQIEAALAAVPVVK